MATKRATTIGFILIAILFVFRPEVIQASEGFKVINSMSELRGGIHDLTATLVSTLRIIGGVTAVLLLGYVAFEILVKDGQLGDVKVWMWTILIATLITFQAPMLVNWMVGVFGRL
ncbi:hypothetical protein [Geomicrobium sp. JCM 19055]|uniref:hypothetical protein n=1 Tax=Geomicrobium sp. JCM 19055 TaxID=1460649 RepID=UPI0022367795|nr:hypothetical protein [Geomicrobium sp. JCM 19055]